MAKWRCVICGYIHEGPEPPETCPVCGVDASNFEKISENAGVNVCKEDVKKALRSISYGLYIISSHKDGKLNGQCANTVFQITSDPEKIAIGINKNNLTHEYITDSQVFSVGILDTNGLDLVRNFGFSSGRDRDKFTDIDYELGTLGVPIIKNCLSTLECKVVGSMDMGTHTLFIGEVTCAGVTNSGEPMTYALYHQIKNKPVDQTVTKAVTQWRCKVCGYIYEGEAPPDVCPLCGVGPEEFEKV